MRTGTVTVVIPLYKGERWIAETLSSVVAQTYSNLEILVVDDGSPDNSWQIVDQFCRKDPRIRLIRKKNAGGSAARNTGLQEAQGEYIAPLDQDDLWHPDKIRLQVQALQSAGPEAGVVYSWCSAIDSNSRILRRDAGQSHAQGDVLLDVIMFTLMPSGSIPLFRTSVLRSVGGYRSAFGPTDDIDLYIRAAKSCTFLVLKEFLVGYRQHTTNVSNDGIAMVRKHQRVMLDARKQLPNLPPRLFRWSTANLRFHYGLMALRGRHFATAIRLLTAALWLDPMLFERVYRLILKKVDSRTDDGAQTDGDRLKGKLFMDLRPDEGVVQLQHPDLCEDRWARRKASLISSAPHHDPDHRKTGEITVGSLR